MRGFFKTRKYYGKYFFLKNNDDDGRWLQT